MSKKLIPIYVLLGVILTTLVVLFTHPVPGPRRAPLLTGSSENNQIFYVNAIALTQDHVYSADKTAYCSILDPGYYAPFIETSYDHTIDIDGVKQYRIFKSKTNRFRTSSSTYLLSCKSAQPVYVVTAKSGLIMLQVGLISILPFVALPILHEIRQSNWYVKKRYRARFNARHKDLPPF